MMILLTRFQEAMAESSRLKQEFAAEQGETVVAVARRLAEVLRTGGKLLLFGNGGSAADANTWPRSLSTASRWNGPPWRPWP